MNVDPLILSTVEQIFVDLSSPEVVRAAESDRELPQPLWEAIHEGGFTMVGLPEEVGGAGSVEDAAAMLRIAGRQAVPLPLAETGLLAGWLLAGAGLPLPDGLMTVAPPALSKLAVTGAGSRRILSGVAERVPWGARAERLVALVESPEGVLVVAPRLSQATVTPGLNLAGEPRDTITFEGAELDDGAIAAAGTGATSAELERRGALTRALLIAGGLERVLSLTVEHAAQRQQFGRPLNRFQAVAHNLALLAEQVMKARMGADMATLSLAAGDAGPDAISAKIVAGEAAGNACAIAHQVHGAIGVTAEYDLQLFTRRLWSWRDEYGSERRWSTELGAQILAGGASGAWEACSASPRPASTLNV